MALIVSHGGPTRKKVPNGLMRGCASHTAAACAVVRASRLSCPTSRAAYVSLLSFVPCSRDRQSRFQQPQNISGLLCRIHTSPCRYFPCTTQEHAGDFTCWTGIGIAMTQYCRSVREGSRLASAPEHSRRNRIQQSQYKETRS